MKSNAVSKSNITGYTREAGVRNLERELAAVCRGVACRIASGEIEKATITTRDLHRILGPVRVTEEANARTAKPGVVRGGAPGHRSAGIYCLSRRPQ